MLIRNGLLLDEDFTFRPGSVQTAGDQISAILPDPPEMTAAAAGPATGGETVDADGCYVVPGLVDIHIHGCAGRDFCDGNPGALDVMSHYLARQGVTSFMPASLALPEERLTAAFAQAATFKEQQPADAAALAGIYLEGPFFAREKRGAHAAEYIIPIDNDMLDRLINASGDLIQVACIAPEIPGALDFIARWRSRLTLSVAHTTADYATAAAAFAAGATQVTHLFNAMNPFGHREPGVPGAAFDQGANVELISDGIHLHPAVIRAAFRLYGPERVILVSDAMAACGMPDGEYLLGDLNVRVAGGTARLLNGTIAGSATNLMEAVRRAVRFGIPLADALRAATANPARVTGLRDRIGTLAAGRQADLVLLNRQLEVVRVMLRGRWLS